jgi:hypothetical protein
LKEKTIFAKIFGLMPRGGASSMDSTFQMSENRALGSMLGLARESMRPRYARVKEFEPHVRQVKAHQFSRTGKIHGVFRKL